MMKPMMMRVLVAGAAGWTDPGPIRRELAKLPPDTVVIHGDSPGADALAGRLAREEFGLAVEAYAKTKEDYRRYRGAGWKGLNERMLATGCDLVLAFHAELARPDRGRSRERHAGGCRGGDRHAAAGSTDRVRAPRRGRVPARRDRDPARRDDGNDEGPASPRTDDPAGEPGAMTSNTGREGALAS